MTTDQILNYVVLPLLNVAIVVGSVSWLVWRDRRSKHKQ